MSECRTGAQVRTSLTSKFYILSFSEKRRELAASNATSTALDAKLWERAESYGPWCLDAKRLEANVTLKPPSPPPLSQRRRAGAVAAVVTTADPLAL